MDKSLKFWVSMIAMCLAFLFTLVAGVSSQVRWVSLLQEVLRLWFYLVQLLMFWECG